MRNLLAKLLPIQWDRRHYLAVLGLLYLLTHLPVLIAVPFLKDEGPYSIMIEEQIAHPTTVVTFFGYEVAWKPPLFFWVYGFFVSFLRGLPIPIEAVYRLPGTLFGLINVFLIYLVFEKLLENKREAFLVAILYTFTFLIINVDSRVLTDTLCGTFVFAGVLAYSHGRSDRRFFILGGLLAFAAYFVKLVNAFAIPIVAAAYLFEKDRKKLHDPVFLASLVGLPFAIWLYNASLSHLFVDYGVGLSLVQSVQYLILQNLDPLKMLASLTTFFYFAGIWLAVSLFGFWKNWRRCPAVSVWYLLSVFPLIAGTYMPWYFYPVIPAIAYFSLQLLIRNEKGEIIEDKFFYSVFFILVMAGFFLGLYSHLRYYGGTIIEKDAGEFLAGKDNVFILGRYSPGIFAYKMLEEKRVNGSWGDFGLIILQNSSGSDYDKFIGNYHFNDSATVDGSFNDLFWRKVNFRKDTNISRFDYLVIAGNNTVNPGGKLVFNESDIQIFKLD